MTYTDLKQEQSELKSKISIDKLYVCEIFQFLSQKDWKEGSTLTPSLF